MGYAGNIVRSAGRVARTPAPSAAPPISVEPRIWYNPELRSTLFLVPGLIAYILMITAVISTALVDRPREGERHDGAGADGADRHVLVRRRQEHPVLLHLARLGGAHHPRGDAPLRAADARQLAGAARWRSRSSSSARSGTGLLISTVAETQQVAFQAAVLTSFLPTLMLSGFIFPISSMPDALQVITHVVPARYFLIALRGIVLKGTPLDAAVAADARAVDLRAGDADARGRAPGAGEALMPTFAKATVGGHRLRCLVWKEFLELRQNPRLFGIVIVAPIIQLTMLGYAATTDVKDVPVVVADGDRSPASRSLDRALRRVAELHRDRHRDDGPRSRSVSPARRRLDRAGDPAGLRRVDRGAASRWRCRSSPTASDSNSTTVALGYATALIGEYAAELLVGGPPSSAFAGFGETIAFGD